MISGRDGDTHPARGLGTAQIELSTGTCVMRWRFRAIGKLCREQKMLVYTLPQSRNICRSSYRNFPHLQVDALQSSAVCLGARPNTRIVNLMRHRTIAARVLDHERIESVDTIERWSRT